MSISVLSAQAAPAVAASTDTVPKNPVDSVAHVVSQVVGADVTPSALSRYADMLTDWAVDMGGRIIAAILVFIIGRFAIRIVCKMLRGFMERRNVELSLRSFILSMVNALLIILLVVAVVGKLGIETTSFAALLASIGLAVGMAFSGNLQNFASGVIILLIRPYKVGDIITANNITGTVQEIQIFHTIMRSVSGEVIYIPNNMVMSNPLINITKFENRLIEIVIGVEYGEEYDNVERVIRDILSLDKRVLTDPAPVVVLRALADSSVNIMIRCTVRNDDYFDTLHDLNKEIYARFNKEGIDFPFPQITVHQA